MIKVYFRKKSALLSIDILMSIDSNFQRHTEV